MINPFKSKKGLGRGLSSLIGDNDVKTSDNKISGSRKKAQLFASLTGILLFVESNISALTVGTIYRPIFDKLKLSREKLAYIADSTSAPSKLLIPLFWHIYLDLFP